MRSWLTCVATGMIMGGCVPHAQPNNDAGRPVGYALNTQWPALPEDMVLGDPTGLDIDDHGHLWVFCRGERAWTEPMPTTPIATNTVLMLDRRSGALLASWGADRFIMPHGLTVDDRDRIWLTDVGLHQVLAFTAKGELLLELGERGVPGSDSAHFNMPTDVAVAQDGSFYVADGYGNSRVLKFDSTGKFLFAWGTAGRGNGQFNIPHAIDLDRSGNVYVADRGNHRVQAFDGHGHFLRTWTDSTMADLYSVCIDPKSDHPVAVDYLKRDTMIVGSDVWLLDPDSKAHAHFGRSGYYDGPRCRYHDVVVDEDGNIYIGDIRGDRLQKFERVTR
jgi:peptidylamidoglycolate lyase